MSVRSPNLPIMMGLVCRFARIISVGRYSNSIIALKLWTLPSTSFAKLSVYFQTLQLASLYLATTLAATLSRDFFNNSA